VGLSKAAPASIRGGDATENARIIKAILAGEAGPARDIVVLNSGAALFIAGTAPSVRDGMRRASEAIDKGDAARTLSRMVALSTAEESAAGAGA
jgi:anthranilate phosphoribosyltransferase